MNGGREKGKGRLRQTLINRTYKTLRSALPERPSLQLQHLWAHRRFANLREPTTFSERIQARKLGRVDPRFVLLADKVRAKDFVAAELGPEWIIPTWWSGERLPAKPPPAWTPPFIIKANYGSGLNVVVRDPVEDWERIRATTSSWLETPFKPYLRERFYEQIPRQLLVEPLIGDAAELLTDYKFFCFGGRAEFIMVQSERGTGLKIETLDRDWNSVDLEYGYDRPDHTPARPQSFSRMIAAAEHLASPFDFVRMDFYSVDERPLFGEYTFTPGAGFERFNPESFNHEFGRLWGLAQRAACLSDPAVRGRPEDASPLPAMEFEGRRNDAS